MDKTTKGLLIALGSIVALAVGMNFASKVINEIAEIRERQERPFEWDETGFRLHIECHEDRRKLRHAEEQRIAMKEFRRYSQSIWEGTKLHQTEPRTVPPVESEEACRQRLEAQLLR